MRNPERESEDRPFRTRSNGFNNHQTINSFFPVVKSKWHHERCSYTFYPTNEYQAVKRTYLLSMSTINLENTIPNRIQKGQHLSKTARLRDEREVTQGHAMHGRDRNCPHHGSGLVRVIRNSNQHKGLKAIDLTTTVRVQEIANNGDSILTYRKT